MAGFDRNLMADIIRPIRPKYHTISFTSQVPFLNSPDSARVSEHHAAQRLAIGDMPGGAAIVEAGQQASVGAASCRNQNAGATGRNAGGPPG
jgi:hypothetical protein